MIQHEAPGWAHRRSLRSWQAFCDAGPAVRTQIDDLATALASTEVGNPAAKMLNEIKVTCNFAAYPLMTLKQARARRAELLSALAACVGRSSEGRVVAARRKRPANTC